MPLDRKQPEYRAVEILMDEDLRLALDGLVEHTLLGDDLREAAERLPLSRSEKARIRLALWLWNGTCPIDKGDAFCLDPENRARFVAAVQQQLGVVRARALAALGGAADELGLKPAGGSP